MGVSPLPGMPACAAALSWGQKLIIRDSHYPVSMLLMSSHLGTCQYTLPTSACGACQHMPLCLRCPLASGTCIAILRGSDQKCQKVNAVQAAPEQCLAEVGYIHPSSLTPLEGGV